MDARTPQLIKLTRKSIGQRLQERHEDETISELKTPMTRNRRKSMVIQSEKKSTGRKSKRRQLSMCNDEFSVESLTEPANLQKKSNLDDNKKLFQKCFVNLTSLTPNKLNLVKTVTSPLIEIRNAIQKSIVANNNQKSLSTKEPEDKTDFSANKSSVDINQNNPEQTLNRTFSFSDDEDPTNKNNDTTFTKEDDLFTASSPAIFNSTAIPDVGDSKRSSISKRLSKSLKPLKSNKLSKSSAINKSSRLSTSRKPKLSGSRAIQLYEFLTEEPFGNKLRNDEEQNDMAGSPPSSSSTPKQLKNHVIRSVLKSTLKKHSVTFADLPSVNQNGNGNCSKPSRAKMPNFALIHKKQFDKMENISDYKERKTERAKVLLSGAKPLEKSINVLTPKNKGIKKELVNSFNRIDSKINQSAPNAEDFVLLPNTPTTVDAKSKVVVPIKPALRLNTDENKNASHSNVTVRQKNVRINVSPTKAFESNQSGFAIRKTPFKENIQHEKSSPIKKSMAKLDFVNHERENLKSIVKNVKQPNITSSKPLKNLNRTKESSKQKNLHTRFGFTAPLKNKKEDVIKAVVNKSRIPAANSNIDDKRAVIKGVRSNRRFDLLMKMRLNK